jgi:glycosyltransferase involved in cell wall biosynthesis
MDTSTTPLISILIPTWNRPQSVIRLIERINSTKHDDIEIIIVDDNSDEKNWLELESEAYLHNNVRLFRNAHNIGMTNNWNKTIEYAKGTWLGFICDDDIYKEGALLRVRKFIDEITEPCLIIQNSNIEKPTESLDKGVETVSKMQLPPASGQFWHRDITNEIGGFDKRIKYCPDDEFWVRIGFYYPVLRVKDFFVISYQHDTNYMWEIFRRPDFLQQVTLSLKTRLQYSLGENYKNPSLLEYNIKDGIWETLRTVINNTFLTKQIRIDTFFMYLVKFIKLSFKMKRKRRMLKTLFRLIIYKIYQPLRPFVKKVKLFISNLKLLKSVE